MISQRFERSISWLCLIGVLSCAYVTNAFCAQLTMQTVSRDHDFTAYSVVAGDVDGDGNDEIVVGSFDHWVRVMRTDGRILWSYELDGLPYGLTLGDVDGDGVKEIAAVVMGGKAAIVLLKYGQGTSWSYTVTIPFLTVTMGDLDGDKKAEVIGGSFLGNVYVFNALGKIRAKWNFGEDNLITALDCGDIDGGTGDELIVGTSLRGVYAVDNAGLKLWHIKSTVVRTKKSRKDKKGKKGRHKRGSHPRYKLENIQTVEVADLDEDGENEVIVCGRPHGTVLVLNNDGTVRWQKMFPKLMGLTSSSLGVAGDFTSDRGKEIFAVMHGNAALGRNGAGAVVLLDKVGTLLHHEMPNTQFFSLGALTSKRNGYQQVLLSSSIRGQGINIVFLAARGTASLSEYRDGAQERIKHGLSRIESFNPTFSERTGPKRCHFLFRVHYKDIYGKDQATVKRFLAPVWQAPGDNAIIITSLTENLHESLGGVKKKGIKRMHKSEILDIARWLESRQIPFYLNIGKHARLFFSIQTLSELLAVAEKSCRGFIIDEDNYTRTNEWRELLIQLDRILSIMAHFKGKKLIMNEYRGFWHRFLLVESHFDVLLKPEYRHMIVPVYKPNNIKSPELNIGMLVGLWKTGIIHDWGVGAYADIWKWGSVFISAPGDIHLRLLLMCSSLGANYFIIAKNVCRYRDVLDLAPNFKPYFEAFFSMIKNRVITPIERPSDLFLANVSLWEMADEDEVLMRESGTQVYWQRIFQMTGWNDTGFFLQVTRDNYLSNRFYRAKHYYDMLFPINPYGFAPLMPYVRGTNSILPPSYWLVKGGELFNGRGEKRKSVSSNALVAQEMHAKAADLPFTATNVYLMNVRKPYGYLLYLLNPNVFESKDVRATLTVNPKCPKMVLTDALSGETLTSVNNTIDLIVPTGLFRIVRARYLN